jgi:hypothetical protein
MYTLKYNDIIFNTKRILKDNDEKTVVWLDGAVEASVPVILQIAIHSEPQSITSEEHFQCLVFQTRIWFVSDPIILQLMI